MNSNKKKKKKKRKSIGTGTHACDKGEKGKRCLSFFLSSLRFASFRERKKKGRGSEDEEDDSLVMHARPGRGSASHSLSCSCSCSCSSPRRLSTWRRRRRLPRRKPTQHLRRRAARAAAAVILRDGAAIRARLCTCRGILHGGAAREPRRLARSAGLWWRFQAHRRITSHPGPSFAFWEGGREQQQQQQEKKNPIPPRDPRTCV